MKATDQKDNGDGSAAPHKAGLILECREEENRRSPKQGLNAKINRVVDVTGKYESRSQEIKRR
jgi:hypothetical protein